MVRPPSAKSILRNMRKEKKRLEIKTPIADEMFLPNNSGVGDFLNNRGVDDASITNLKADHIAEKTTGHNVVCDNIFTVGDISTGNWTRIRPTSDTDIISKTETGTSGSKSALSTFLDLEPTGTSTAYNYSLSFTSYLKGNENITGAVGGIIGTAGMSDSLSTATLTTAYASNVRIRARSAAGGSITTAAGSRIQTPQMLSSGHIDNYYGIKVEDAEHAEIDNAWAIHTGNGLVHFGDDVEVVGRVTSATATITASSDTTDVSGINTLFINITGDIVLGGLTGGVNGQTLNIVILGNFTNHVRLEHAEGVSTQDFINHIALDEDIDHGGCIYICNGSDWYDASHSKHV